MPSHTAASALIKLYFLDDTPGAPWEWPVWQELTHVTHGLFPPEDEYLPKGWSRRDANDVLSYFQEYNRRDSEESKIKFAVARQGNAEYPGRKIWANFVLKNWEKWGIHNLIVTALRAHDVHPISLLVGQGSLKGPWPIADLWVPIAADSIALALFGIEAFANNSIRLSQELRKPLAIFAQRSWARIRDQVRKDRDRIDDLKAAAQTAFEALDAEKVTKAKIISAIRAVAKWKDIADIYGTPENLSSANDMLSELNRLMNSLGAKVPQSQTVSEKRLFRVNQKILRTLATAEDLVELLHVYSQYFRFDEDDERPAIDDEDRATLNLRDVEAGDLGMEVEALLDPDALAQSLGFIRQRLPHQFNTFRHKSGFTAWNHPDLFKPPGDGSVEPLRLHWHQLAGVHSIIRNTFTKTSDAVHNHGILVCDEVGLGKTTLCISTIAFLNQVTFLQAKNENLPPLLRTHKFLGGEETLTPLPHLIVVPGTLRAQWIHELQMLFLPKSIDIFEYNAQKDGDSTFWGTAGIFHKSKQSPQNKIIVTTHSSLLNEFKRIFRVPTERGRRPWDPAQQVRSPEGTLFQERFLSVTIDKAHEMRNLGAKQYATMHILKRTDLRLVLTGTPLTTAPRDLESLGRLVGVPYFYTERSHDESKAHAAEARRAKKMDDDGFALRTAQIAAVRRIQREFYGSVLRRTVDSRNWRGQSLLDLPPHKDIVGVLELTERENEIIQQRAEEAKARIISANETGKFLTNKFYLEYRMAVGYAKADVNAPNPIFNTLAEWEPLKSTKMEICAQICKWYLRRDDVPDIDFEDGKLVFPEFDPRPSEGVMRERKVLIYAEFPLMHGILRNVLKLHGVDTLSIDGNLTFEKCDKIVTEFHQPGSPRVFIFSSIGTTGLNLAIADVVIFDQPWSAQDERQIRGRAHRQPQKSIVKCIYLLASNSSDILMSNMARGKEEMFEAFVNKELGKELRDLLSGKAGYDDNGEKLQDVDAEKQAPRKKRQSTGQQSRQRKVAVDSASESQNQRGNDPSTSGVDIADRNIAAASTDPDTDGMVMSDGDRLGGATSDTDGMNISDGDGLGGATTDTDGMDISDGDGLGGGAMIDTEGLSLSQDGEEPRGATSDSDGMVISDRDWDGTDPMIHQQSIDAARQPQDGISGLDGNGDAYDQELFGNSPPRKSTSSVNQDLSSSDSSVDSPLPKRAPRRRPDLLPSHRIAVGPARSSARGDSRSQPPPSSRRTSLHHTAGSVNLDHSSATNAPLVHHSSSGLSRSSNHLDPAIPQAMSQVAAQQASRSSAAMNRPIGATSQVAVQPASRSSVAMNRPIAGAVTSGIAGPPGTVNPFLRKPPGKVIPKPKVTNPFLREPSTSTSRASASSQQSSQDGGTLQANEDVAQRQHTHRSGSHVPLHRRPEHLQIDDDLSPPRVSMIKKFDRKRREATK